MRVLCAAAVALSVGLWIAWGSSSKAESKAERATKLAERKKKYDETMKELVEKLKKVGNPVEARAIQAEMREETIIMAGKVLAIAEGDPKDEVGFDAAAFIVKSAGEVGAGGGDVDKALAIISEHHATDAKVKDLLLPAVGTGEAGEKFVKAIGEKATDKPTKATALFIRGLLISSIVDDEQNDKKQALLVKEAIGLIDQAAKLAPETPYGEGTIGKFAAAEIEGLNNVTALAVGRLAPEAESKLLSDGKGVKLSDYRGKVVMLDVWATWCGPCKEMIPHERELVARMKGKPFELISLSVDDKKETLQKFLEKEQMPWTHWWDNGKESSIVGKYRIRGYPTIYVLDHNGVIRHKWFMDPGPRAMDAAIDELVKAAEKK
jgi:thiol-disulfide isomerase/thioredoxin